MKNLFISLLMVTAIFARVTNEETGWFYDQSTFQSFYMFETIEVDGDLAESGDVVGAFKGDVCVGWVYADEAFTTLPLMGNDGSFPDYMGNGDTPDEILIYDASNGSVLSLESGDLPGWLNNEIFIIEGTATATNTFGCTDEDACNYDDSATADDGSCADFDCAGDCGGDAEVDDCDVCNGGNADLDCAGECFGDAEEDCAGVCNGDTVIDECGECGGSNDCFGCTDDIADNYDETSTINDGSCEYTVPGVTDFSAEGGGNRAILNWTAPEQMGSSSYNYDIYMDGDQIDNTTATGKQITGLAPGTYCFAIVANNDYGSSDISDTACADVTESVGLAWALQFSASICGADANNDGNCDEGWLLEDNFNYIGTAASGVYGHDGNDIPEPPASPGNNISLSFAHLDWTEEQFVVLNKYQQDVVTDDLDFFEHNLSIWYMVVDSDVNGFFNLNIAPAEGTPYDVPMYIERFFPADNGDNNHDDEDREIWGLPTTGASNIDGIYISHEEEQYYQITIGNRVPVLDGELHAHGDDRRIHLDWEDADELYPADYYTVYREEADDVDLGDSHYTDSEDRQGHDGQGLLYESDWGYFVTATNAAGESTNSTIFRDSSGEEYDEDGTGLEGGARTNDNLDPVARTNHIGADCTDFGDGAYEVNHDNDPGENPCTMEVYGGESGDDDEFDEINRYHWELEGEGAVTEGHENDFFAWLAVNAHDGDTKHFTATLTVESDYPVRDGIATRSNSTTISTSLADEPNEDPVASSALDLIDAGDGASVSTSNDYDNSDWNDYDADAQLWYEPHDNNGDQNNADLHFDSFDSFDDDGDDLSYEWHLVTGALAGFSYDDLNGNDAYDFGEPFVLNGGDEIYDDLDLGDYVAGGPGAEHVGGDITQHLSLGADVYILTMTVTDVYGDSDASSLVVGVKPERNEGPSAGISDDQRWFMNYEQDQKEIDPVSGNASDPDSDDLHFAWSHSSNSNQGDLDLSGFDSSCGHGDDGCEPRVVHADLEEGTHTFTITATDSYGESASASNTVVILDEPNSPTATVTVTHTDLKWVEINVTEGTLDTGDLLNSDGSLGYTGDLQNTSYIDVFRNGDHLVTFGDDGDINEQFVDADLSASTEYIYTAISYNSDGYDTDADGDGTTTGDRPTVEVINPNGYEIFADGHAFDVHIATTDDQYIHKIEVDYNGNHYEYDGGHVFTIEGDATEVDYHSGVTVTVTDYGNYYGDNKESNQDSNDEDFITADQVISHDISDGWNLVGTQVELFDPVADLAMGSLGSFGDDWILYRSDGYFDEALLELNVGEGYFLYSYGGGNWVVEGEPVTGDPENGQLFSRTIGKGWNLVANPLVTYHDKNLLELEANGERKTWEEARFAGWVAESVLELFDGSSYLPTNVIRPSEGYWINTSLDELTIHFTSHAPSIDLAKENGEHLVRNYLEKTYDSQWNMILQATDGISSDEVIVALADEASDAVVYGEDEDKLMNRIFDGVFVSLDNNLYTDYRDEQYSDYESWTVKVAEHNSPLTFTADFSDIEADVHVVINGEAINLKENATFDTASEEMTIVVGDISKFMVPTQFALGSAYPNPFNPSTKLNLDITQTGHVSMEVYNIKGQVVETLLNGVMSAGYHTITWNANQLSSGMYFVKVIAGDNVATQKVMLLK